MVRIDNIHSRITDNASTVLVALLLCVTAILPTGCTRNNGDIGDWFGKWQVMEIKVNGQPDEGYEPCFFWEFQNDIIRMVYVGPTGYDRDTYYCYGTWTQPSDNVITFDFSHTDDNGRLFYKPFGAMHFPGDRPFSLSITDPSGKNLTLKYVDETTSTEYTYLIRKR